MITLLNLLQCNEDTHQWDIDEIDTYTVGINIDNNTHQELSSLLSKESHQRLHNNNNNGRCSNHRRDVVQWILGVASHYSFAALTAVLAVNYFDRFFDRFDEMETGKKKPWMSQLAAVACLSIAAKVEETHVPLLLDLQIDGSKYVFEAKTVQKMEILILTTLEWKMNPVTPLSFLGYVTRRLGLKPYLAVEFINRCECVLLCFLLDGRFRCHLPSVVATATMVHVINSVEPCIGTEFQSQLLAILSINKEEVEECRKEIREVTHCKNSSTRKRKFGSLPKSPDDVTDLSFSSDESWSVVNPSVPSSPEPGADKSRKGADKSRKGAA
ncbi:putative cyclin domain-containing protein [Helianthus annuus]|nr:putative cyclin domain-containing protein [Helianthus annuus]KAJ0640009.1 putative cyclin domain-containing protein [Helianthus annuus]KAJ0643968.1 putative cyclin domain-containing protein [Helianthus annuus]KAJ0820192.1 putative cyclin [Helianthus annuus]KAJ0834761.1 putative cyclin domain-containing protein [Helianthus annuus]